MASTEVASMRDTDSGHKRQCGNSRDSETASDNSRRSKVAAVAALAGISYDFGQSSVTKTRLTSMECHARYFLKGYNRPPGAESETHFFIVGLQMPPHPVLVDILSKF
jgi:hypothetical protein